MPTIEEVTAKDDPTTTPAPRFLPLETIAVRLEGPSVDPKCKVFGVISNMSATGACVITNVRLPSDTDVRLEIASVKLSPVAVPARIVWCAERLEPVKEIVGYLTGVTFEADADATIRELLSSGLFQLVP